MATIWPQVLRLSMSKLHLHALNRWSPRGQAGAALIELGGDHITAFVKTITEPMEAFACLTCIRSMLEPWRVGFVASRPTHRRAHPSRKSICPSLCRAGTTTEVHPGRCRERELFAGNPENKDRIDEVEQDALETGYAPIAKMPSATDVIKLMLDEESAYRLLSAVPTGTVGRLRL